MYSSHMRNLLMVCVDEGYIVFVFPFVRSSFMLTKITSKFSFLKWVYLNNHSSKSIHTRVMGALEGLLTFHEFLPHGPFPGVGLEVKN